MPHLKGFPFDPEGFWTIAYRCMRGALGEGRIDPARVAGVAATSQRQGCVFLDEKGRELYAGPNMDARAIAEGLAIAERFSIERLHELTGHSAPFLFPLARYLWHRKHTGKDAAHLLMISDWHTYRLTGNLVAEPSNAAESMLFDIRSRDWCQVILREFSIPASVLPPLRRSGEVVGAVTPQAAEATGIPPGTPVFAGGADTQCSLLGSEVSSPGAVGAVLGTTTPVQMVLAEPRIDPQHNLWTGCHVLPDLWVLESNAGDTGGAYLWLLDLVAGRTPDRRELFGPGEGLAAGPSPEGVFGFVGPVVFDLARMTPQSQGEFCFRFPCSTTGRTGAL